MPRNGDDARGVDALIRDTSAPVLIKTSVYLRPDQIDLLDRLRTHYRKAGLRTTSQSDLLRTALDVAERHDPEWGTEVHKQTRSVTDPGVS